MKIYIKLLQIILPVLFLFGADIHAQLLIKPGGTIYNTELWLSADNVKGRGAALPTGESKLMEWIDLSGNNRNVIQYEAAYQPTFSINNQENYNPSIYFADNHVLSTVNTISTGSDKSYYIFIMSEVESSGRCIAFNLNGNTGARRNLVGWNDYIPYYSIAGLNGTSFDYPSSTSGVIGAIITNMGNEQLGRIFFNGSSQTSQMTSTTSSTPGKFVVGASLENRANPFYGNIQEVIVLSNARKGNITNYEATKINTYLAVKYGIALPGDYIASDDTKIWDAAKNAGYSKYVFGLGRDDASGLHVKQSRSYDVPSNIIYVGDQLANLNSENTATNFNDKQFVMLGYSLEPGAIESIDYNHDSTDVYLEGKLNVVNYRVGNVMKAQLTNLTSAEVKFHVSAQWILVSNSDPKFAPANTRVYPVDLNTNIATVTLHDGDYVDFAYFAEGPGGILGKLKLWLRADAPHSVATVAGNKVDKWFDQSGLGHTYDYRTVFYRQNNTTRPTYMECDAKMNFQPSVYFDVWDFLGIEPGPMSVDVPDDYTSFIVYNNTSYSAQGRRLYTHGFGSTAHPDAVTRHPAMGFSPTYGSAGGKGGGRLFAASDGGEIVGSVKGFVSKATALHMIHTHTGKGPSDPGYITHDFGAYGYQIKDMQGNNFGTGFRMGRAGILGGASIQGTGNASGSFIGSIAEVIFFQRALSVAEQDLIRGYLATKYGITIDPDPDNINLNYDYKLSNGVTVWGGNSLPNKYYHNNVVGLMRDDASGYFINKGKSSGASETVSMNIEGHTECGQGNVPKLENLTALYWGHNGKTGVTEFDPNDADNCGKMALKSNRMWLVDKTNMLEATVSIWLSASDDFPYASAGYQIYLLLADDSTKINNNKWDLAIPASFVGSEQAHRVDYTFKNKYTYFSLGVKVLPGSCQTCDFKSPKKVEFSAKTWAKGATSKTFDLGDGFGVLLKTSLENATASWTRNYPRSSSLKSLQERRRRATAPKMITEIEPSQASSTSFQIFNLDREGSRYKQVKVIGYCSDSLGTPAIVIPHLSYVRKSTQSSYVISGNTATAKRRPTSGYAADAGKLNVVFDYPVEKIVVEETATGARTGSQTLGISPIKFWCPAPLPPFNEAGLTMTKQATDSVELCTKNTPVDYTFRIYNANCDKKFINIVDTLPDHMHWDLDKISIDDVATTNPNFKISISPDGKILRIDSMLIIGGAEPFLFNVQALLNEDAVAGIYENRAWLESSVVINDVLTKLPPLASGDFYQGVGFKSKTVVVDGPKLDEAVVEEVYDRSCYAADNEIAVTLTINNPNGNLTEMFLDIAYNSEFKYIPGSFSSNIAGIGQPIFDQENGTDVPGYFYFEDFTLPAGNSVFKFKIKAPVRNDLEGLTDANGNALDWEGNILSPVPNPIDPNKQAIVDLNIDYGFYSSMSDDCLAATLQGAKGNIEIPFCRSKAAVIVNKHVTTKIKKR